MARLGGAGHAGRRRERNRAEATRSGGGELLVDEGGTLVEEVAGGDLTDEVDGCGLRAGEEGTRRQ